MTEKRRDNRKHILHGGEYQQADGWYRYRYIDEDGQENNVYSWHLDKKDVPTVALHWKKYMPHVVAKYNKIYRVQMPKLTPHVYRQTFCSNMAKSGMDPRTLQYIMGHSDIRVTLNTYTHVQFDNATEELLRAVAK